MPESLTDSGSLYSPLVGFIYLFNLIVGTGALTMPKAFDTAGWLISLILIVSLAIMSYMTVTFVIEVMAAANAIRTQERIDIYNQQPQRHSLSKAIDARVENANADEQSPLLPTGRTPSVNATYRDEDGTERSFFAITERIEMGTMSSLFFNKVGLNLFYICMAVYLYGDLAIYAAAVPKSMRDVACTYRPMTNITNGSSCNMNLTDADQCWPGVPNIDRNNAYRIFLAAFTLMLGPFLFFNVQKTKYLQMFTSFMRWLAFGIMITLAAIRLGNGKGEGHPEIAKPAGIPTLFGVCIYSFMCHHSLPSLATPIRNKSGILRLFAADYILILGFYAVLSFTGIFSFAHIEDLYTLNFQPNKCDGEAPITKLKFIEYFLALFPVFTLSTNFPIIGITLRNNLKTLVLKEGKAYPFVVDRLVFPVITLIPPLIIAFITNEVEILVGITGSYAGAAIQYFIPAFLVYYARKDIKTHFGPDVINPHRSPFKHVGWVIFVVIWAVICITFVTVNHIITKQL